MDALETWSLNRDSETPPRHRATYCPFALTITCSVEYTEGVHLEYRHLAGEMGRVMASALSCCEQFWPAGLDW